MTTAPAAAPDPFDYAGLHAADRKWLQRAAPRIRAGLRAAVAGLLDAAKALRLARKRLGTTRFARYAEDVVGISRRTACRLVRVGEAFAEVDARRLVNLTPTAVYELSAPGVPQGVREYALKRAADGEKVTAAFVTEIVASYHDKTVPNQKEVRAVFANRDPEPKATPVEADDLTAADNWRLLVDLLESGETVHLSPLPDADEDAPPTFHGWTMGPDGRRGEAGATVEAVLLALANVTRTKVCGRCGERKRIDLFSKHRSCEDGRNRYCKVCERKRVSDWERTNGRREAVLAAHSVAPH